MTSTAGIVAVPNASAAIACAPADPVHLLDSGQGARGERQPASIGGGVQTTTSSTPADRAVTTPITTVLG